MNVFVEPSQLEWIVAALAPLGCDPAAADLPIDGVRFRSSEEPFPVDVFPSLHERYEEIRARNQRHVFGDERLPFLSAQDLALFKLSFGRPQDWVDLAAIAAARPDLDVDAIEELLVDLRGPTMYPVVARFRSLF